MVRSLTVLLHATPTFDQPCLNLLSLQECFSSGFAVQLFGVLDWLLTHCFTPPELILQLCLEEYFGPLVKCMCEWINMCLIYIQMSFITDLPLRKYNSCPSCEVYWPWSWNFALGIQWIANWMGKLKVSWLDIWQKGLIGMYWISWC